jgi:ribosomal protein S18 acetylase RimI-like enzyme
MEIHEAGPEEWKRYRATRLAALADSPSAFGSSLAAERERPEAFWRERLAQSGTGGGATFGVIDAEGEWHGLAGVFADPEDRAAASLVSMWVHPRARGQGLGRRMIEAAAAWTTQRGIGELRLWVTQTNEPAIALYRSCGFEPTGERQPLPSDPSLIEFEMRRAL